MPAGTILVVRKGMYGGPARVPPELEGVAQVVEWRHVGEYAAVTDFVWLRRIYLNIQRIWPGNHRANITTVSSGAPSSVSAEGSLPSAPTGTQG